MESAKSTTYLPTVDGLRAIAVVAVMIFHANPAWLPGGYAGVDVFFVISGYLITKVILAEQTRQQFSLWRFWDRRVRRILPPLLLVLAAFLIAGYALLTPSELAGLGSSSFAGLFSAANVYFWLSSGSYFGLAAPLQPHLHLWSLGVEEQFYLIYPIAFVVIARMRLSWLLPFVIILVIGSFALAIYTSYYHPSAGFYLPFARVWELALGCGLALRPAPTSSLTGRLPEIVAATALLALVLSFYLIGSLTPWPGSLTAIVVCATGALIVFAPTARWTGGLLSARPLVAIGLVSYGAYLWHHPILAFARLTSPNHLGLGAIVALLAVSLFLAACSYRFIEQPARDRNRTPARLFWTLTLTGIVVVASASIGVWKSGGAPWRLPSDLVATSKMTEAYPAAMDPCFYLPGTTRSFEASCLRGSQGPISMAIIGDSHAMALAPGFDRILKRSQARMRLLIAAGCPPVTDPRVMSKLQGHCAEFARRVYDWLLRDDETRVVVIAARWPYAFHRSFYDNGEGGVEIGPDDGLDPNMQRDRLFELNLDEQIGRLLDRGKTIILVDAVPEPGWDVPKYLVHNYLRTGIRQIPTIDERRWRERAKSASAMIARVGDSHVFRIRPADMTCGRMQAGRCALGAGDRPWYFDDDHPSRRGALLMIEGGLRSSGQLDEVESILRGPGQAS